MDVNAIRRCGELLKQIESAKNQHDAKARARGGASPSSRSAAADAAGLSRDQKRTALRVASIPRAKFERDENTCREDLSAFEASRERVRVLEAGVRLRKRNIARSPRRNRGGVGDPRVGDERLLAAPG